MKVNQASFTIIILCLLSVTASAQSNPKAGAPLSNSDVIEMVKDGLSNEIIIAKVINSPAAFDTTPTALKELKAANVPNEIILAIVRSPLGMPRAKSAEAYPGADDESAATGIGRNMRHDVRWVNMDLENRATAEVTLRYEYYAGLVRLGIQPRPYPYRYPDTMGRRERANGFEDRRYSPEP